MGNCWRSAAIQATPASTSGTSAAGRCPRCFRGTPATVIDAAFAHSGYLLATSSWDGTTRLWDGVSGEPLAMAPGMLRGSFAPDDRRLAFRVGGKSRRLGRSRGPRVPDAPPRHARQPLRDAGDAVGMRGGCEPRRPAGGDHRLGTASASGRPTRAASWPISSPAPATPCCFTPTEEASSPAGNVWPVSLADPARSRRRGRSACGSVRPSCCRRPGPRSCPGRPGSPIVERWR